MARTKKTSKPRRKAAKKRSPRALAAARARAHVTTEDARAIMQIIDHAKARGLAFFEGPAGLKFAFKRETQPMGRTASRQSVVETGDDAIPG